MPRIKLSQLTLNYELEAEGQEGRPALVLINGLTMDINGWANQVGEFNKHFRVLRYDCRGQGESDKPDMPYTHEMHARDLAELMEKLSLSSAHIVGISNGGMVAQHMALDFPDKVRGLVLTDTTSSITPLLNTILTSWIELIKAGGMGLLFNSYLPFIFGESFIEKNAADIALMRELSIKRNPAKAVLNLITGSQSMNLAHRLSEISAPTLIVHGEDDILIPLKHARVLHEGISGSRLETIPDCGHVPPAEQPGKFNRLVVDFLKELRS